MISIHAPRTLASGPSFDYHIKEHNSDPHAIKTNSHAKKWQSRKQNMKSKDSTQTREIA
jgi:hypothetical protein